MNKTELPTIREFKEEAKVLRRQDPTISNHSTALEILARKYGYKHWRAIKPLLQDKKEIYENNNLPTFQEFKNEAKELCFLDPSISSFNAALDSLAIISGYNSWKHIRPYLRGEE